MSLPSVIPRMVVSDLQQRARHRGSYRLLRRPRPWHYRIRKRQHRRPSRGLCSARERWRETRYPQDEPRNLDCTSCNVRGFSLAWSASLHIDLILGQLYSVSCMAPRWASPRRFSSRGRGRQHVGKRLPGSVHLPTPVRMPHSDSSGEWPTQTTRHGRE